MSLHDATFMMLSGRLPVWSDEWNERVRSAIAEHGKDHPVEEMVNQRIGTDPFFGLRANSSES